jgi:VWFA-related protein
MMPRRIAITFLLAMLAPAQQDPPQATFRAGTDLVQVNVVAQDKDGKPVTDLRRDDFQIFDNGAQQEIRLFLADRPTSAPPEARAPGIFTNQIADGRGGYSVLLFDNLNIDPGNEEFAHTARARQKALLALREISPNDKVAIYALGCRFQVVREFTSDRDSLIQQLGTFGPAPGPCADPSSGDPPPRPTLAQLMVSGPTRADGTPMWATAPPPGTGHAAEGMAAASAAIAADLADRETLQLAEHLAGIPGRKNLIWLTTTFHLSPSNLRKLINAGVAIYPVDTQGSTIALAADKAARAATLGAIAAQTGGVAFVDRDDLDVGIRGALEDGRISYTLGYYRPDRDNNKPVHQIGVRVSRPGVTLRYRTSYTVEPPPPKSANPVHDLVQAMNSPVDATAIRLVASVTRSQNRLDISGVLDVAGLDLELIDGLWKGKAELVARFVTADGKLAGKVVALTMTFNLRPATCASALQRGFRFHRAIAIPPKAVDMNLLIGNVASGKIGTLTIPLSEVRE